MVHDGPSEALEWFIVENNVSNFFRRLDGEQELGKRAVLSDILHAEARRFVPLAAKFGDLEFYVRRCDVQITRCKLLIEGAEKSAQVQQLERFLQNMSTIKTMLQSALDEGGQGLDGP
jgi:hypothetical protein